MTDHGTKARFEQHKRDQDEPCDLCLHAEALYMREWRARHPDRYQAGLRQIRLRSRAKTILAQRHPAELRRIMAQLRRDDEAKES